VFATNYDITIGLITAAREKGVWIPAQMDIVGFDCPEVCAMMNPPVPVVHQPEAEIGQKAAHYLIQRLDGFAGPSRTTRLACTLVPDQSV
jgi:DNA-binding LacI/PurR family transcriptional regulator